MKVLLGKTKHLFKIGFLGLFQQNELNDDFYFCYPILLS